VTNYAGWIGADRYNQKENQPAKQRIALAGYSRGPTFRHWWFHFLYDSNTCIL